MPSTSSLGTEGSIPKRRSKSSRCAPGPPHGGGLLADLRGQPGGLGGFLGPAPWSEPGPAAALGIAQAQARLSFWAFLPWPGLLACVSRLVGIAVFIAGSARA